MRFIFGILSFCLAGFLAFAMSPMVRGIVLPYLLEHKSGFSVMQFGPLELHEPQMCILAAVVVLVIVALIVAGIYAFIPRRTTA
jgi:uncharacterized BrkB/YihY/UPF0761 family membrane protein